MLTAIEGSARLRVTYKRRDIVGCPVDAISLAEVTHEIRRAIARESPIQIVPCNVDSLMKARRDSSFMTILGRSDVVVADGVPVVWAASLLGTPLRGRVSGTDVVWECARISAETQAPIALIGSGAGVGDRAAGKLMTRFPGAALRTIRTPDRLDEENSVDVIDDVRRQGARIMLVALGAPRQEAWIQRHLPRSGASVGIGIGSAFDIISGDRPQAPQWMRDCGLEWANRLRQEPRRLGRRYLLEDSPFVLHVGHAVARRTTRPLSRLRARS